MGLQHVVRRGEAVDRLNRRFVVGIGVATAVLGAGLGTWTDIASSDDWSQRRFFTAAITTILGLGVLIWSGWNWRKQKNLLAKRGSAYLVDAEAQEWTNDAEKRRFLKSVGAEFAQVYSVPGPNALDINWRWPAVPPGEELWSGGVDDLVLAFRAVQRIDDELTPNNVLAWLPWPAAIATMARLRRAEAGLPIVVRQRPIGGRMRDSAISMPMLEAFKQDPHDFLRPTQAERRLEAAEELVHPVMLTVMQGLQRPAAPGVAGPSDVRGLSGDSPPRVRVLLARSNSGQWDELTTSGWLPNAGFLDVADYAGIGFSGEVQTEIHEWRYLPPDGKHHSWASYADIAHDVVDWICRTAITDGINLFGSTLPQEVSLGMGLDISSSNPRGWPRHLWPLLKPGPDIPMSIPGLSLGLESLTYVPQVPRCS